MKVTNETANPNAAIQRPGVQRAQDRVSIGSNSTKNTKEVPGEEVKVSLSDRAQDIVKAREVAMKSPDVRPEKISGLKNLIQSGQYKINSNAIADRMVDEVLRDLDHT